MVRRSVGMPLVVTVDSPAFSFGVADRLRGSGIPTLHVNAPKVWAYRPRRVQLAHWRICCAAGDVWRPQVRKATGPAACW